MNWLVILLLVLLFFLIKLKKHFKFNGISKTKQEKSREKQEFFDDMEERSSPAYSFMPGNINNDD